MPPRLRVFIGSGEASLVERKVLQYSLDKFSGDSVEVVVYNGTHDTLEYADGSYEKLNTDLSIKYRNLTEFSNFRWYIPRLCNFEGRAVYLDSDMVCLADIAALAEVPMDGCSLLTTADGYNKSGELKDRVVETWNSSMCLIDCAQCRLDPDEIFRQIEAGRYSLRDLHGLNTPFLEAWNLSIGLLPPGWNDLDYFDNSTRLIHYTELDTQPWKYPGHPYGELWFNYLSEALQAGYISPRQVNRTAKRGYIRRDIWAGNFSGPGVRESLANLAAAFRRSLKAFLRKLLKRI